MKMTVLAITALFAATVSLALAQEDSPSPAASPELTVSEKNKSSDPSVSVTTEKTVSPTPKAKASASPTKSSSPAPKSSATPAAKSSASPAAKSSASPAASPSSTAEMPAKKSTAEATIRDIEEKWEASVKNHDSSVAQTYLADDFHGISSKGKVMTKANLLAEIKKDTDAYSSTKNGKIDVRVFDGKFAVATAIATEAGKSKDGQEFKRSFRWTDVWVLRNEKWLCVASQAMLVQ